MLDYKGVKSTAITVDPMEFCGDNVRVRTNIQRIDEEDTEMNPGFHGWQYDEKVYTKDEYILTQTEETNRILNTILGVSE